MKTRVCAVAIIEKDGKILLGQKVKDRGPYPNTWLLPGGGVEEGESVEAAIKREIKEETGLDVKSLKKLGVNEDNEPNKYGEMTHYIFHGFKAEPLGEYVKTDEFPTLKWVDVKNLGSLVHARPSMKLFEELGYV
jgi:nucleoside triphosphatase